MIALLEKSVSGARIVNVASQSGLSAVIAHCDLGGIYIDFDIAFEKLFEDQSVEPTKRIALLHARSLQDHQHTVR